jgi:hypothetical protein
VAGWLALTAGQAAGLQVLGSAILGGLVYAGLLVAMRVPETKMILKAAGKLLGRFIHS